MTSARITIALENGVLALPATGRIGVFRPSGAFDTSAMDPDRLHCIQGFRPDYDQLQRRGLSVSPAPAGPYAASIVEITRAKAENRALVATALELTAPGGPVLIDGARTDGIDSLARAVKTLLPLSGSHAKAHGRLLWLTRPATLPAALADWRGRPTHLPDGAITVPGVFSANGADAGSSLLLEHLPASMPGHVVDLGAGWGYLARALLDRPGIEELDLVEAENAALNAARSNVHDPRARFYWADATTFDPESLADLVVTNPPFHNSRSANPHLGIAFITAAARLLKPSGRLWLVANRHLPYERALGLHFRQFRTVTESAGFKIFEAGNAARRNR